MWGGARPSLIGFWAVFIFGSLVVLKAGEPRGPMLALAAVIAYQWAVVALWRWGVMGRILNPTTTRTRGMVLRLIVFLAALIFGGSLVLNCTPGGPVAAIAASIVYVGAVTAVRAAVWGWRD